MPDLVGIGSLNVDLVVDAERGGAVDLHHPALGLSPADVGSEREVTAAESAAALDHLAGYEPIVGPGGSSLNVVRTVAATGAPVTVGQIGRCGTDDVAGFSLARWLDRSAIDTADVDVVDGPPGVCLAITHGVDRTLLTTTGVNRGLGRFLATRRATIVDHLLDARIVHVTALAGLDDLDPLIDVLDEVRRRRPGLLVSVDPGAIWTEPTRPALADAVIGRSHTLLVNRRELSALAGGGDETDAVLERFRWIERIVVKGPDRVVVHRRGREPRPYPNPRVLEPGEVVDDTGAGDAFAAGYLLGQLLDPGDEAGAVERGMDLARAAMGMIGLSRPERFR